MPNGMDPFGLDWVWPWDPNATWTPAIAEAATDIAGSRKYGNSSGSNRKVPS